MVIFSTLFFKILILYTNIFVGYFSAKKWGLESPPLSNLLLYFLSTIVIFATLANNPRMETSFLALPVLVFFICTFLSLSTYFIAKNIWCDARANILAFAAGVSNSGNFGLPVAFLIFQGQVLTAYMMAFSGMLLFCDTIGFFLVANGKYTIRDSIIKVITLPRLYAFIFGIIFNLTYLKIPEIFQSTLLSIRGTYIIISMLIIGIVFAKIKKIRIGKGFVLIALVTKFIIWPLIALIIILIDKTFFNFFDTCSYQALMLISIVPIAVYTVLAADVLNMEPERAAAIVIISTIIALFYVPIVISLFTKFALF
ncbi:AEC family transporter [Candidatus Margulisiibacteriota bacterium]